MTVGAQEVIVYVRVEYTVLVVYSVELDVDPVTVSGTELEPEAEETTEEEVSPTVEVSV